MEGKYLLYLICIIFLLISCTPESESLDVEALPIDLDETLSASVISIDDEVDLINPQYLRNVDEYLVILDRREENLFKVFRLPDLNFLYSWGRIGRGPGEFQSLNFSWFDAVGDTVILNSPALFKLGYYAVTDSAFVLEAERALPMVMDMQVAFPSLQRIHDSLYVASYGFSQDTEYEFAAMSPDVNELLFTFGNYPETNLEGNEKFSRYVKTFVGKPDGSRMAAFYSRDNLFKLFDNKGELIRRVRVREPYLGSAEGEADYRYRGFVDSTEDFIFVLGVNATPNELLEDPASFRFSLEVWDWEGHPLHRIMMEEQVIQFAISDYHGMLYGFTPNENSEIYQYDISYLFE